MNGHFPSDRTHSSNPQTTVEADAVNILKALEIIHSPQTNNDLRRQASDLLEHFKRRDDAARQGTLLASDPAQPLLVRHFGLSLLVQAFKHQWHELSTEKTLQLRAWTIELGQNLSPSDPPLIRNKVAELWVELAKRSWALDWFDLDELLVTLWDKDIASKAFVLTVLENLSEDVFAREDSTAMLRGQDLHNAVVEMFTASSDYAGGLKINGTATALRFQDQGWLRRIVELQDQCISINNATSNMILLRCLATTRSVLGWIMTPAIIHAACLPSVCSCLSDDDESVLMAASDTLAMLFGRSRLEESDINALVLPLCSSDNVRALAEVYIKNVVGVQDVDSPKYTISKKLSEFLSYLADFLTEKDPAGLVDKDCSAFFQLLLTVAQHESLIVSIPAVHSWAKILNLTRWRKSQLLQPFMGPVLNFASSRTLQYDLLPEDGDEPALIFVNEEIELFTERQGFYINYRRLCYQIIDRICYAYPNQVIPHLLTEVNTKLDMIQKADEMFDPSTLAYTKNSRIVLQADAQYVIVEYSLKSFATWRVDAGEHASPEDTQVINKLVEDIKQWCSDLLTRRTFRDPLIKQRTIKCAVEISNRALHNDKEFALLVLEHILTSFSSVSGEPNTHSDAVNELHMYATNELRRLAIQHADYFVTFYDQLSMKLQELHGMQDLDEKSRADISTTLFLIVQRAATVEGSVRKSRMHSFIDPVSQAWQESGLQASLSSFETFYQDQSFDKVAPYLSSNNQARRSDWAEIPLDRAGYDLQREMLNQARKLPLRITRTMLGNSVDKLSTDSGIYQATCELWSPSLPIILESILRLISYAHKLHDSSSWPNVLDSQQRVVVRVLRDRYWQVGISDGSMHQFHAKIKSTKETVEGFASSVRARLRLILENCYSIFYSMSKLGSVFYHMQNMPSMTAQGMLATAATLSPHHFGTLLNMFEKIIEPCPAAYRSSFLGTLLPVLITEIDRKCLSEWTRLEARKSGQVDDPSELSDEMREESLLRVFTYKSVNMVASLLHSRSEPKKAQTHSTVGEDNTMQTLIFSSPHILQPLLLFTTHVLSYHDTRSCSTIIQTQRSLVLDLLLTTSKTVHINLAQPLWHFVSSDLLKAAITAFNDGYFVDHQRDLASLIATIWLNYGIPRDASQPEDKERPWYSTVPRTVLLSLPGLSEAQVDNAAQRIAEGSGRQQRAAVLELLQGFRGVRMSELGKIDTAGQKRRLLEQYKARDEGGMQGVEEDGVKKNDGVEAAELEGVQDLFG